MNQLPDNSHFKLENLNREQELEKFLLEEQFVRETAQQIIKDFAEFDLEIQFSGDTQNAYPELFQQMEQAIRYILDHNFPKLLNLLYRIDIGEKEILKRGDLHPDASQSELITDVIIRRELKKVLMRYYFKHFSKD